MVQQMATKSDFDGGGRQKELKFRKNRRPVVSHAIQLIMYDCKRVVPDMLVCVPFFLVCVTSRLCDHRDVEVGARAANVEASNATR